MFGKIKSKIRNFVLGYEIYDYYFAQGGEDNILSKLFPYNKKGFYVDIGAYHPYIYSNTFYFYKQGWTGINIDANPDCIHLFNRKRKRDINLSLGVGIKEDVLKYYVLGKTSSMNTFSYHKLEELNMTSSIQEEVKVQVWTLEKILETYLPANQKIDFISIDVEGSDFQVLQSNNWDKYKPSVVIIELDGRTFQDILNHPATLFLQELGYDVCAKNILSYNPQYLPNNTSSVFFVHKDF